MGEGIWSPYPSARSHSVVFLLLLCIVWVFALQFLLSSVPNPLRESVVSIEKLHARCLEFSGRLILRIFCMAIYFMLRVSQLPVGALAACNLFPQSPLDILHQILFIYNHGLSLVAL